MRRSLQETLDSLAHYAVQAMRADGAAVSIIDPGRGMTHLGTSGVPVELTVFARKVYQRESDTPLHRAFASNTVQRIDKTKMPQAVLDTPLPEYMESRGWDKGFVAPLRREGEAPIGLLHAFYLVGVEPDEDEIRFHQTLATFAAVAIENVQLFQKVEQQAADAERNRLGRELHDSVSQTLFSIGLGAQAALENLRSDLAQSEDSLRYILKLAQSALGEMRALIFNLHPEALQDEGLSNVLRSTFQGAADRYGLTAEIYLNFEPELDADAKHTLFRIAGEALHNSLKHGHAQKVGVSMSLQDRELVLIVTDNGLGFDAGVARSGCLGLRSMQERADALGARLAIQSVPGQGTEVKLTLPISNPPNGG